jgi:putative ABC transport system permease protein
MISLAGRDILHAWGKFVFTGIGLGLLIGVTLVMAGVPRHGGRRQGVARQQWR